MALPQRKEEQFSKQNNHGEQTFNRGFSRKNKQGGSLKKHAPDQTFNVRTSSMPGAPRNETFVSGKRDIATDFNAEYAKKGIQPAANDSQYRQAAANDSRYAPQQNIRAVKTTYNPRLKQAPASESIISLSSGKSFAKNMIARERATVVNTSILAWGIPSWLFFQLPLAILSIVFLGFSALLSSVADKLKPTADENGFITIVKDGVTGIFSLFSIAVEKVTALVGIDLSALNPDNIFLMTHLLVIFFGLVMMLAIYIIYKISLLRPLGGRGEGMKLGALLLCLIGYSIPILNLLPWFIVWIVVVWIYPK